MNRPEVRIIEPQHEVSKEIEVSNWEKEQLLAKYGYVNQTSNGYTNYVPNPTRDLSYAEMMELEDRRFMEEQSRRHQELMNRPRTYSIDQDQVRFNETRWSNMDIGGKEFGIQVQVVSDMKFPR